MTSLRQSLDQPLRRGDYLILRAVLVAAAALAVAWALVPPVLWATGEPLTWRSQVGTDASVDVGISTDPGATVGYDGGVLWAVADPTAGQIAAAAVPRLLTAVCVLVGCLLLRRLLQRLRRGDAFAGGATAAVRGLAVVVLLYAVVVRMVGVAVDFGLTAAWQREPASYLRLEPGAFVPFALGLMLLALAECFRQGARLRDDVDGLV